MANVRLTPQRIREFETPAAGQVFYGDTLSPHLALRVTAVGGKAFVFKSKLKRQRTDIRLTIGDCAEWTIEAARAEANRLQVFVDQGIDPRELERANAARDAAERAEHAAAQAAAVHAAEGRTRYNLGALCEAYVRYLQSRDKARAAGAARSAFSVHVYPHRDIAAKPAREVSALEAARLIRRVQESGKERTAGVLRSYLYAAYNVARKAPLSSALPSELIGFDIQANPLEVVPTIPVKSPTRTLAAEELKRYLDALGDSLPDRALKLALYAGGQRMAQLLRAKVSDFDPHTGALRLFDGKGKRLTPRLHVIPLAPEGAKLATVLYKRAVAAGYTYLFAVGKDNGAAADEPDAGADVLLAFETPGKRLVDICTAMGGEAFDLRAVRRTVETMLAQLRVSVDTRAQLLSHGLSGVQHTRYDQHSYADEKFEALIAWEARLKAIKAGRFKLPKPSNVVELAKARKRANARHGQPQTL